MSYPPGGYGGYPNQGYPPPGYGYGPVEHPQGNTVLVLGIVGIVACQICAPIAWSMGNKALAEIDRDPMRYSNRSNVNLGRILGMVGTIILGVSLALMALYFVFIFVVIGTGASTS